MVQQDLNVRPKHFGQWWSPREARRRTEDLALPGRPRPPFVSRRAEWVDTLHRWFDHGLLVYDHGIDDEPMADIERHPDEWVTASVWPHRGDLDRRPGQGGCPHRDRGIRHRPVSVAART